MNKIKNWALFWFILLIPTQLGKHWWPEWSLVEGVRIDYLSPTLYLVDLVWVGWVLTNLKFKVQNLKSGKKFEWRNSGKRGIKLGPEGKRVIGVVLGLIAVGINILGAENRWSAGYRWLRLGQGVVTIMLIKSQKAKVEKNLKIIMPIWIAVEGLLGMAQVINSGSLGGWFYWFGERKYSYMSLGVALMSIGGELVTRAYGTFSHPNSLAGFLGVSWWWWQELRKNELKSSIKKIEFWVIWWLGFLGVAVSGSRTVWIITIFNLQLSIINYLFNKFWSKRKKIEIGLVVGLLGLEMVVGAGWWGKAGGWDREGGRKRWDLITAATMMIKDKPQGVGLGNFVVCLPPYLREVGGENQYWWQPVHNAPLLLLAELGVGGVLILIYSLQFAIFQNEEKLGKRIRESLRNRWMIWMVLGVTALVDHYWVTLPQNGWLWGLWLGVQLGDDKRDC